jgi:hypothetical protein
VENIERQKRKFSHFPTYTVVSSCLSFQSLKQWLIAKHWLFTPVIPATWEAEIGKITVPPKTNKKSKNLMYIAIDRIYFIIIGLYLFTTTFRLIIGL